MQLSASSRPDVAGQYGRLRCGNCRTTRSCWQLLAAHLQAHPECAPCRCGGYWYPHRRGSRMCDGNPLAGAWRASRAGATDAEFRAILAQLQADAVCPF